MGGVLFVELGDGDNRVEQQCDAPLAHGEDDLAQLHPLCLLAAHDIADPTANRVRPVVNPHRIASRLPVHRQGLLPWRKATLVQPRAQVKGRGQRRFEGRFGWLGRRGWSERCGWIGACGRFGGRGHHRCNRG